ncbi:class I SAM-dependent DNA methyltransferase [Bordetella genomosp. 11]|nr:class I SAM-dependent methyltransferase [Bordetella genomosp. 11]
MNRFDTLYRQCADPWQVRASWYEQRKRAVLLAALPRQHYGRILELGCGNGEMTRGLASRCDALVAIDGSETAIALCALALRQEGIAHVRTHVAQLPDEWPLRPDESCELVVVSELAYYIPDAGLAAFLQRCHDALAPGGEWVMCHYTKDFDDREQPTSELHARVDDVGELTRVIAYRDERFQLDIWRKPNKETA